MSMTHSHLNSNIQFRQLEIQAQMGVVSDSRVNSPKASNQSTVKWAQISIVKKRVKLEWNYTDFSP